MDPQPNLRAHVRYERFVVSLGLVQGRGQVQIFGLHVLRLRYVFGRKLYQTPGPRRGKGVRNEWHVLKHVVLL